MGKQLRTPFTPVHARARRAYGRVPQPWLVLVAVFVAATGSVQDGTSRLTAASGAEPLAETREADADEPDLSPLPLGDATKGISPQRIEEIKRDLARRVVEDQAVRTDKGRRTDMSKVDEENAAALRTLVQEIGWIDAERFGREAAAHAFLIVQHSGDLRLMQAALPLIEKEMKQGIGNPQEYAMLYDRLQLMLGKKQRYGSQVGVGPLGNAVVLPLEDRSKVEQFRKEIGLFSLAMYLEMIEKVQGSKVRFADEEEKPAPPK